METCALLVLPICPRQKARVLAWDNHKDTCNWALVSFLLKRIAEWRKVFAAMTFGKIDYPVVGHHRIELPADAYGSLGRGRTLVGVHHRACMCSFRLWHYFFPFRVGVDATATTTDLGTSWSRTQFMLRRILVPAGSGAPSLDLRAVLLQSSQREKFGRSHDILDSWHYVVALIPRGGEWVSIR